MNLSTHYKKLETILAELHLRSKRGLPLMGGPEDDALSEISALVRDPLYKQIKRGLEQGEPLSKVLSQVPGIPPFAQAILEKGENNNNLSAALEILLEQMPFAQKLKGNLISIVSYFMAVYIAFICYAMFFKTWVAPVVIDSIGGSGETSPMFDLFYGGGAVGLSEILLVLLLGGVALRVSLGKGFTLRLLSYIPFLSEICFKVTSMQLAVSCGYHMKVGDSPLNALENAAESLDDPCVKKSLREAADSVRKGESLRDVFASRKDLVRFHAVSALLLGESSKRTIDHLDGAVENLKWDLSRSLNRDMRKAFSLMIIVLGALVGASLIAAFRAIIMSYDFYIM